MEDGIENYTSMLMESTHRVIQSVSNETSRLYIYLPDNICNNSQYNYNNYNNLDFIFENVIITDNKEKIMDLSDKKKGQLLIFKKDSTTASKYTKI
jgi:hypothetical protein